jgi:cation:H+ antiporter
MSISFDLGIIVIASVVIYFAGSKFAVASSRLGDYLKLPRSVKGATFDAVSSSMPELMIALFSVIFFGKFEVGVGTIAGSALFNLLIIPAICVLVSPVVFKVSKEIIHRDGMFYIMAVFTLLVTLVYFQEWGYIIPIVLFLMYLWYFKVILKHTKIHKESLTKIGKSTEKSIHLLKEIGVALLTVAVMGVATYFMTDSAISFSEAIGVPAIIIAFTVIAAATSIPDAVVSIANARKGDIDDAASNVFGSNIFDIFIGLSLPVIIGVALTGSVTIVFQNLEIIFGLMGATILVLYFLAESHTLTRRKAWFMLFMYAVFLVYVFFLSTKGVTVAY